MTEPESEEVDREDCVENWPKDVKGRKDGVGAEAVKVVTDVTTSPTIDTSSVGEEPCMRQLEFGKV